MKREVDEKTLYSLFDTQPEMEHALTELVVSGIAIDDISVLMTERTHDRFFSELEHNRMREGAVAGALGGALIGSVLTSLVMVGGVAGIVVAGPIMALAAIGAMMGALLGHGVPAEHTRQLQQAIGHGKALLAVRTHRGVEIEATNQVFDRYHGDRILPGEAISLA